MPKLRSTSGAGPKVSWSRECVKLYADVPDDILRDSVREVRKYKSMIKKRTSRTWAYKLLFSATLNYTFFFSNKLSSEHVTYFPAYEPVSRKTARMGSSRFGQQLCYCAAIYAVAIPYHDPRVSGLEWFKIEKTNKKTEESPRGVLILS